MMWYTQDTPIVIVAKGEQGHPTRTRTQVYRVPNMLSDRHTKEPGSPAPWHGSQRAYSTVGTITSSHCPHLREAHPCASRTQTSLTHTPIMLLPSRAPHTHKCFTQPWGPSHGVNIPGGPSHSVHRCTSDDLTAGHPTTATKC